MPSPQPLASEVELTMPGELLHHVVTAAGVFGITPINRTGPLRLLSVRLLERVTLWTSMPTNDVVASFLPSPPDYRRTDLFQNGSEKDLQTQEGSVSLLGGQAPDSAKRIAVDLVTRAASDVGHGVNRPREASWCTAASVGPLCPGSPPHLI